MDWLGGVFGAGPDIGAGQECARAVLVFGYGWMAVRVLGRRVFGKWAALDIIVSIVIGSNLSRAITGSAPLWGTLGATTLVLVLHWLLAQAAARFGALGRVLEGRPVRLVVDGKVDRAAMRRWSISEGDLEEALRQRAIGGVERVKEGVLEASGKVNLVE